MAWEYIIIVVLQYCLLCSSDKSNLSDVVRDVFADYDPIVIPFCAEKSPLNLTMDMAVRQLIDLDEPAQILKVNLWIRLKWIDCHISWNPNDYRNITDVVVPFTQIWTPDLALYDGVSTEFYGLKDYRPHLYHDGTVLYNFPTVLETECTVDVTEFPFDEQICTLQFGSWTYHGLKLDINVKNDNADLTSLQENVEWQIIKVPAIRREEKYGCCPEPYPSVTYSMYLKRKPRYYEINIILPSFIITLLATLGYILPVDSGEKISLEVTVVLSLTVFQLLVANQLPPSAEASPWISVFFSFTLCLCGISTIIQAIVINIYYRGNRDMLPWLKRYVLKTMSYITLTTAAWKTTSENKSTDSDKDPTEDLDNTTLWQLLSICIDRVCLILFIVALFIGCISIFSNFV